jgi:hypothetical protein
MANGKTNVSSRTRLQKKAGLYSKQEIDKRWKKIRGLLRGRGPKNPVAWQRQMRKDRTIV